MKICVIGGANVDITAQSKNQFIARDSNPGTVRLSFGGVGRNIAHNLALLGDEVCFVTRFGGDAFGQMLQVSCREIGMDISLCEACPTLPSACFASINDSNGEMLGGVADMAVTESISTDWLADRIDAIDRAEGAAVFQAALYIDAVSGPKAVRLAEALNSSVSKRLFTFKCNALEALTLSGVTSFTRRYVTRGAEGLEVTADGRTSLFPALPCSVRNTTGGGDALLAGIVHAGPRATVEEAARIGLLCARYAVESDEAVNEQLKYLQL